MKTRTRRQFIKIATAVMLVAAAGSQLFAAERSIKRPNIVFVFADQMGAHAMGCMGNEQVITPHLDKLAGEGILVLIAVYFGPLSR